MAVKPTGGWRAWKEITVPLENVPEGPVSLGLSFSKSGEQKLLNLDWIRLSGGENHR